MFPCLLKQHTAIGSQRTPGTAGPPGTREGLESVCREDKSWFKAYKRKAHPAAPAPRLPASKPPLRARAARTRRRGTRPCFPRSTPWPPVAAPPPCPQPRAPRPSALLRAAAAPPRRCSPKRTAVVGRVGRASLCAPARKRRAGQAQAGQRGLRRQARQLGVVRDARAGRVQLRQRGQVRRQVRQRAQRVARKAQPAQAALACRAGLGFHCAGPPKRSAHERVALPAPHACLHAWRSGRFRYGLQLLIDMSMHGGFAHCVCQRGERWEAINRRLAQSGSFCGSVTASWRTSKGQGVEGLDGVAVQAQLLQRAARGQARHGGQPVARQVQPPQACHLGVQSDSAHAPYRPKEPSMCMHLEAERASRCREVGCRSTCLVAHTSCHV